MPTILLPLPTENSPILSLLAALDENGFAELTDAIILTTDSPHVVTLLAAYGRILPDENNKSTNHTGGGKTTMPPEPTPDPLAIPLVHVKKARPDPEGEGEEITYTNVATGEVHTVGAIRQMLRFGRVESGQEFYHSKKGLMVARVGPGYKMKLYVVPKPDSLS
ncbi:MAG: hypothetical protein HUU38_09010 [Anaerolineales bacterium]|nr:hypothetical protein [Anaerolineales bacterium]